MTEITNNSTVSTETTVTPDEFVFMAFDGDFSAYIGGDRKFRSSVREYVKSMMKAHINPMSDFVTAQWYNELDDTLSSYTSVKSDTPDMSGLVTQMVIDHLIAAQRLANGDFTVEGAEKPDMSHLTVTFTVESDKSDFVAPLPSKSVESYTSVKVGRKPKLHDIQPYIATVYNENGHVGTFMKVSDIRRRIATIHDSSCSCGKNVDSSWDGRISAALFGKNPPNGLEPVEKGHVRYIELGGKGAIMTAESVTPGKSDESDESDESDSSDS